MPGTVLGVSSRALLEACRRLGIDTGPMLQAAGLNEATLQDPDARIDVARMEVLWREAYARANDPDLALHAIEILPFGAYRVVDFLAATAPSLGAAFAKVAAYFPLINSEARLPYTVGPNDVAIRLESLSHPAMITRPYAEYTLAAIVLRLRIGFDNPFRLIRVDFSHPASPDTREHERIFGCPVRFDADVCQLVIAREVWDTPRAGRPAVDEALFAVLESHARLLLEQVPRTAGTATRVREAIAGELRGGDPQLASIARQLAMSPRTLQRRLKDEGVVFNDVLDELRFRTAKSYLATADVATAEVAYLLGFSEQSSFNRAFKRWSGRTPTDYRRGTGARA